MKNVVMSGPKRHIVISGSWLKTSLYLVPKEKYRYVWSLIGVDVFMQDY